MTIQTLLSHAVGEILTERGLEEVTVHIERPADASHGDYASNIALILAKKQGKSPRELALDLKAALLTKQLPFLAGIDVAGPGFLNFTLKESVFSDYLLSLLRGGEKVESAANPPVGGGKRVLVEYAHPNTHKEMHIGHMRTLITGEALARILTTNGATVFRANYQGDIGPHVAKALYGIEVLLEERNQTISQIEGWNSTEKAHFLGEGYARGSADYEAHKEEIDALNSRLYQKDPSIMPLYEQTRAWSLSYYDEFYTRFYTKFDSLFFESDMVQKGKEIVQAHIGDVFTEENGAVIFPGEKYGLHTRVFITQAGNPTYEGKEMANAFAEHDAFPFDLKMHIVANEQAGYFKVVFQALDLIDPKKFAGKQHHLSMGMVQLVGRKMSSRTGDVLTVDWLLDQIKAQVLAMMQEGRIDVLDKERVAEQVTIGAVKYSVLKVSPTQDVAFDIQKSVALDGDSGPYVQYTYARTQSVLRKAQSAEGREEDWDFDVKNIALKREETTLLRTLAQFPEVIAEAGAKNAPNTICTYLFDIAQQFNAFYQKLPILKEEDTVRQFRLALTAGVGKTLNQGLNLLGIEAPERM